MKLGITNYEMLSTPKRVKVPRVNTSGDPAKDNKVSLRVQFLQKDLETNEVSNGDYGYRNFEVLMKKDTGKKFSVKREKDLNGFYHIEAY